MTTIAARDLHQNTAPFLAREGEGVTLQPITGPACLWVLMDPKHPIGGAGNQRWQFVRIHGRAWEFKCACGVEGCTLEMRVTPKYRGRHPTRG
jgi:hypothetical protein